MNNTFFFSSTAKGVKPEFPEKPKIRQAGKNIIFECVLNAQPLPTITWSRGGENIADGGRYKITRTTTGTSHKLALEITGVTGKDGGEYKVFAKNNLGESMATINLNIGAPKKK